jgi:AraC-like DNA-binding protein
MDIYGQRSGTMLPCVGADKRDLDRYGKVKHAAAESTVRVGGILEIPTVLRGLGADPVKVFADARVDLALFDDPDNLVSFAARGRLMRQCVTATGCAHFGLLVGQRNGLHHLGLLGLLVKYSPDVGMALRSLVRFFHLRARGAVVTLTQEGGTASLGYEIFQRQSEASEQIADGALAFEFNIMRTLGGPSWTPSEVRFAHGEPADTGPFRRFFNCPLSFDAGQNVLVFDASWLHRHLPTDDPTLRSLLQKQIDALEAEHGADLPAQVRSVLRTALLTRHAKADQIAALFSMHCRTLARHLEACGTGYQVLVDEVRFEIARQLLAQSAMDVREVAAALDYADASAFTRAFRRWSGATPAAWRARRAARRHSGRSIGATG